MSSAAQQNPAVGVHHHYTRVWIPGEGWIKWATIERQVSEAYRKWRWRKAMAGVKIMDAAEKVQADVRLCK